MKRILVASIFLLVTLVGASSALASHYLLEDVPFISVEERTKLESLKILATEDLLKEVATPAARRALVKKSGLSKARVLELSNQVDLLQVRGIGPKMVMLFQAAGYANCKALNQAKLEPLYKAIAKTNDTKHISEVIPSRDLLASWIRRSGLVPVKLK